MVVHCVQPLLLSDLYSQERVASHSLDALTIRSIGRESLITITKRLKVQFKRHDISKVEESRTAQCARMKLQINGLDREEI